MPPDLIRLLQSTFRLHEPVSEEKVKREENPYSESGFRDLLHQIERRLRSIIEERLTQLSGLNWIKQRIPCEMRKRWEQCQEKDRSAGRIVHSLIQYANFTDLVIIIIKQDNWKDVFNQIFKRREEIQVSLQRLHPIRNSLAHSRPLSKSDKLTLAKEADFILSALGVSFDLSRLIIVR